MCGRYVLFSGGDHLLASAAAWPGIGTVVAPEGLPGPRFNIAPTTPVPIVRAAGQGDNPSAAAAARGALSVVGSSPAGLELLVVPARWGLLPHWKKDLDGPVLFNARTETMAAKPSFRAAVKYRRCLVPMNGYYEWRSKQPYFVSPAGDSGCGAEAGDSTAPVLWAAGLWDTGLDLVSAAIVTTAAREPIDWLHDRMPVFLEGDNAVRWLTRDADEAVAVAATTQETIVNSLVTRRVGRQVGDSRTTGGHLISPAGELF
ncbi:SOS response-associated peptidase [Corynebacterium mendelii]|uniref:Abasic site processing protein n=1 Tax=Corynebacterium mendelii TaxID=2765362 RepID=A0A939E114_9CORY|nr:SOS response-associated peptidase [Corynebacterium mendelii]